MHIGFDLSVTRIIRAGTAIYAVSLFEALRALDGDHTVTPFIVPRRDISGVQKKTFSHRVGTLYQDLLWGQGLLPLGAARRGIDLLHVPTGLAPLRSPCPTVLSILDVFVLSMPHHFPFWQRTHSGYVLPRAARNAAAILTISEYSKAEIVTHLDVDPDRVTVTYLDAHPAFQVLEAGRVDSVRALLGLDRPYLLAVGTLEPRKNLPRLLEAFAAVKAHGYPHQLAHVGGAGWLFDEVFESMGRLGLADDVVFLGRQPLDVLAALYNGAMALVYPSLGEGFGLPVLEAMRCACPVITSNRSSLPEVIGEAGLLVDPLEPGEIATAIERVMTDEDLAARMRHDGLSRSRRFSWERCASETLAVYRAALGR